MKGQILDIFPEGEDSFRACVLEIIEGSDYPVKVVNLDNGGQTFRQHCECELPIINNVFELPGV